MAILLRGKKKGQELRILQWCNDWFHLEDNSIVSPLSLKLTPLEMKLVLEHTNNGFLLNMFELRTDGTFKKRTHDRC